MNPLNLYVEGRLSRKSKHKDSFIYLVSGGFDPGDLSRLVYGNVGIGDPQYGHSRTYSRTLSQHWTGKQWNGGVVGGPQTRKGASTKVLS